MTLFNISGSLIKAGSVCVCGGGCLGRVKHSNNLLGGGRKEVFRRDSCLLTISRFIYLKGETFHF